MALVNDRQHKRLLRLTFPRGDGPQSAMLANRLYGVESLSRDSEYTLDVLSDDAGDVWNAGV